VLTLRGVGGAGACSIVLFEVMSSWALNPPPLGLDTPRLVTGLITTGSRTSDGDGEKSKCSAVSPRRRILMVSVVEPSVAMGGVEGVGVREMEGA